MDFWHGQGSSFAASVAAAGFVGVFFVAAIMGLFSWKNHMPVEGKTVLITGATEGLGRSLSRMLAAKGANVIMVARNVPRLEETLAEVQAAAKHPATQHFHILSADVSVPGCGAKLLADATAANRGQAPDIVWCAAGMSTPLLFVEDEGSLAALRRNMDVNFFGSAEVAHAAMAAWVAAPSPPADGGPRQKQPPAETKHLIFTASVLALYGILGYAPYTPTKWALRGLADTLAQEARLYLPATRIRVHTVYPGTILTPGFVRETATKPAITQQLEKDDPQQTPDEVAARSIAALERGNVSIVVNWLGSLMLWGIMGGGERNNWIVDTFMGLFIAPIYATVRLVHNSEIAGYVKKNGHPSTWTKKAP